ncbi:hypothetical protein C8R45DRAFT_953444 [Mycena sanguinolenta]|nr:hypothetical protein C8R45DRAFT_953444 [Mycena sanguinolenta]
MPTFSNADLVVTAFTTGENAVLEWLGDALISAAVVTSVSRRAIDCDLLENRNAAGYLCSERFLAHLSLLYGMQLHDYCDGCRNAMPGMSRMCDIFESLVGAAASDVDPETALVRTMRWLERVFDPWVAALCTPADLSLPQRTPSGPRRMYASHIRKFGDDPVAFMPAPKSIPDLGSEAPLGPDERQAWVVSLLGPRPSWRDLDVSGVTLGADYPPAPPSLVGVNTDMVTTVFTDVLYRIRQVQRPVRDVRHRDLQVDNYRARHRQIAHSCTSLIGGGPSGMRRPRATFQIGPRPWTGESYPCLTGNRGYSGRYSRA